jgi:hypothetical protein
LKASNDSSMIAEGDNKRVKTINPATEVVNTDARKSVITFRPIGVIGSVMP